MKTPGVTVRPIITLDGGHEVNEVWLDDVRVPVDNLVGKENKGWTYAKFLLAHERTGIAGVARSKRGVERLREIAATELDDGRPLIEDADLQAQDRRTRDRSHRARIHRAAHARRAKQAGKGPGPESLDPQDQGHRDPAAHHRTDAGGASATTARPYFRGARRRRNELRRRSPTPRASPPTYSNMRKTSIYGGSNEIQHNIIAKMVLGL